MHVMYFIAMQILKCLDGQNVTDYTAKYLFCSRSMVRIYQW